MSRRIRRSDARRETQRILGDIAERAAREVSPSIDLLQIEAAALASEVYSLDPGHPLLPMWYGTAAEADLAEQQAQEIYGLPGASVEERNSHEGQLYFWRAVKRALKSVIEAAKSSG